MPPLFSCPYRGGVRAIVPIVAVAAACAPPARPTAPPTGVASATASATSSPTAAEPPQTSRASPTASASGSAAYCAVADVLTPERGYDHPEKTVLDRTYMLPADYAPPDLAAAPNSRERVRAIVMTDLTALLDAAAAAGHPLVVVSGYRSFPEQQATFDHWVSVGGYDQALRTSARAGHSEHQLGVVVDLGDGSRPPWEYDDWAATPPGAWLAENATSFGFVLSYPRGKSDVTCYDYEPWHYRWVGRDMAARLAASGLTLHELQTTTR